MSASGERSETCETCRFWRAASSECRRRAPAVPAPGAGAWPVTAANEWCGEWAPFAGAPTSGAPTSPDACVATCLFLARVAPALDARNPEPLLASLLEQLPSDVRGVLVRTNGLDGRPPAGLREVAREFKMSQGHVRALIATGESLLTEVVRLLTRQRERS